MVSLQTNVSLRSAVPLVFALACLAAATMPTGAGAATTFGSGLENAPNDGSCMGASGSVCGSAIAAIAVERQAPGGLNAPADGVVVRWRVRGTPAMTTGLTLRLRIYRGNSGVGTSDLVLPALTGDIEAFETRLPIETGDRLGLNVSNAGMFPEMPLLSYSASGSGTTDYWPSPPVDGATVAPAHADNDRELLVNADVEVDADGDGFGDETQDLCPTDVALQTACPSSQPPADAPESDPGDTTKPLLSRLRLNGTRGFRFATAEAGTFEIQVDRVIAGKLRGANCSRNAKRGARCKIYRRVKRLTGAAVLGNNSVRYSMRKLKPGRYSVSVIVVDQAGNESESVDREFTIKRERR